MKIKMCLIVLTLFGMKAFASKYDCYKGDNIYDKACKADRLKNKKLRPKITDPKNPDWGFQSGFGAQIHPACFKVSEGEFDPALNITSTKMMKSIDGAFTDAMEKIFACKKKYPELDIYLDEWISQFRRTVFSCIDKTQEQLNYGAMNVPYNYGIWTDDDLNGYAGKGMDDGHKKAGTYDSLHKNYMTAVFYPKDSFQDMVTWYQYDLNDPKLSDKDREAIIRGRKWQTDTIIHEVLHSTHANNRHDHNCVEFTGPSGDKKKFKCSDNPSGPKTEGTIGKNVTGSKSKHAFSPDCGRHNVAVDRVNVIATLCAGSAPLHLANCLPAPNNDKTEPVELTLYNRVKSCDKNECVNLFTEKSANKHSEFPLINLFNGISDKVQHYWSRSKGLKEKSAKSLCAKLKKVGECQKYLYDIPAHGKSVMQFNQPMNKLGEKMAKKMEELFPPIPGFSGALLNANPAIKNELDRLKEKSPSCFSSMFVPYSPINGYAMMEATPFILSRDDGATLSEYSNSILGHFDTNLRKTQDCDATDVNSLKGIRSNFKDLAGDVFSSTVYKDFIANRYARNTENFKLKKEDYMSGGGNLRLRDLLGKETFDDYVNKVSIYHPDSPDFNCQLARKSNESRDSLTENKNEIKKGQRESTGEPTTSTDQVVPK